MAVTGRFEADFTSFYAAVQKAEVSLKSFEQGAGKVESSLDRMANSLSGRKLIQDAALMAEAVERVGGTSKLTQAELQRVGGRAAEAVEKLKALGIDVPPGIAKIAAESKTATSTLGSMRTMALSVASAFGVAFSIGALKSFIGDVVATAGRVDDLSKKLGVSTDAVQRWEYAVKLSGGTIETIDRAVAFMNRTLSDGDKGTVAILAKIGLSFDQVRLMRPEDAFNAIAEAISKIEDPMLRAEAATKLFSRSGQDLLPAIAQGFVETAKGASVMSEETIRRLDAAGDAWTTFGNKITIVTGEALAVTLSATERVTSSWGAAARFVADVAARGMTQAMLHLQAETAKATASTDGLAAAHERARAAAARAAVAAEDAAKRQQAFDRDRDAMIRKMDAEAEARGKALAALQDRLFGRDVIAKAQQYATALDGVGNVTNLTKASQAELNAVMAAAYDVLVRAGQGASSQAQNYRLLRDATVDLSQKTLSALPGMVASMDAAMEGMRKRSELARVDLTTTLNAMQGGWLDTGTEAMSAGDKAGAALDKIDVGAKKATESVARLAAGIFSIGNGDAVQLLADANRNLQRGGIAAQVGQRQIEAARTATLPKFDKGGPITQDGPIYAHKGEYVVPKGGVGTTIIVNVSGGADPQRTGQRVGEAVVAELRARGQRI